jgi:hypothetical protein
MSRSTANFIVDAVLLLLFVIALAAQMALQFAFPAGTQADGWRLWGLGYDAWSRISFASLAGFAVGVLVHLMLHWNWVCGFVTARLGRSRGRPVALNDSEKTIVGVTLLIIVLTTIGGFVGAATFAIAEPPSAASRLGAPTRVTNP